MNERDRHRANLEADFFQLWPDEVPELEAGETAQGYLFTAAGDPAIDATTKKEPQP